jgi:membrane-associated phospholipid phosphatase
MNAMPWLSPYERRRRNNRIRWWAIALGLGYLFCALVDRPVYLWFGASEHEDTDWMRMFRIAGFLPTWLMVAGAMALVDRAGAARRTWGRAWPLMLGAGGAGLAAEFFKRLIGRERPIVHDGLYVYKKFLHGFVDDSNLGIPSSHVAVAFGAAFMLIRLYPPVWPVALAAAVGCAAQRVAAGAHFTSDVYAAAVLAYAVTALLSRGHPSLAERNAISTA